MKNTYKVGDQVKCSFAPAGSPPHSFAVVRSVTYVEHIGDGHANGKVTSTGWLVSADGGQPCPHCGATVPPVPLIDSGYFELVSTQDAPPKESAADKARKALDRAANASIESQLSRISEQGSP